MDGMVERAAYELAGLITEEMQIYRTDEDTEDTGIEDVAGTIKAASLRRPYETSGTAET